MRERRHCAVCLTETMPPEGVATSDRVVRGQSSSRSPLHAGSLRSLPPWRDAERAPSGGEAPASTIVRRAEALGIPWKRILRDEIQSEERLRATLADVDPDVPFWSLLSLLPFSFLQSWRVRDRIEGFAQQAQGSSDREAIGELRKLLQLLTGTARRDHVSFGRHLWFAYQRVLLLQRVSRAAAKCRHLDPSKRVAAVCARAHCSHDDAVWAVCREMAPRRGHSLDAAVQRVREEGYRVPRLETEARSFARLRSIVRSSRPLRGRHSRRVSRDPISLPARVAHPVDAT
jgi:hypothetical protein